MKLQNIVLYRHKARNLFYVGLYNAGKTFNSSSSLESNCQRAAYAFEQAKFNNKTPQGLSGGFYIALVNTNFIGWTREVLETDVDIDTAKIMRESIIQNYEFLGLTFVGSEKAYSKGTIGAGTGAKWNTKFNVKNMTKAKIQDKIDFISKSMTEEVSASVANSAYMAIVLPERYGPKARNFGSYKVEDLGTLFIYVRDAIQHEKVVAL